MDILRIFLYVLLLITAFMTLDAIIAFVGGRIWSQGKKLLRSIGGVVGIQLIPARGEHQGAL